MTIRSRLDAFERQIKLAQAALSKQGRLAHPLSVVNDPEENLDEYRLDPGLMTIEIGKPAQQGAEDATRGHRRICSKTYAKGLA